MVKIQGNRSEITEIVEETMTTPKKKDKIYSTVKLSFSSQKQVESKIIVSCETYSTVLDFSFHT